MFQLSPPPEKALALMHRLASDPGIVAIMKKVNLRYLYIFLCRHRFW